MDSSLCTLSFKRESKWAVREEVSRPPYTDAHTLLEAGVQMTSYEQQLLPSPPDRPLHPPSASPGVDSSVINVLRCHGD
ncbi:hypothetical protein EYF80_031374 [Liparis tanakae]|uniref:Uncharacterized protein n=1 Tax=Liparis tanakae TaxID=230148 RepID=A0A4Z2H066_9TELE|nr:hypothetical protein EYF80_031374 [Liparis tanakae]